LKGWVQETAQSQALKADEVRFTRRDIRAVLGWGDTQLKIHLSRLLEMEYLLLFRRGLTYEYGLLWDGEENGGAHLCGLLDVTETVPVNEGGDNRSGSDKNRSASGRGTVGGRSEGEKAASGQSQQDLMGELVGVAENAVIKGKTKAGKTSLPVSAETEAQHDQP
nr:DNA primase [Dickeya chrysanthemi]